MKRKILSIALVTAMTLGVLGSGTAEARNPRSLVNRGRGNNKTVEVVVEEENTVSQPTEAKEEEAVRLEPELVTEEATAVEEVAVVEEVKVEAEADLVEIIEASTEGINVKDFGAVADANYYNPSNGNYYSDPAFKVPATDATDAINKALRYASENGIVNVFIPEGNYLIDAKGKREVHVFEHAVNGGIQMQDNTSLNMTEATKLVTNTVDVGGYALISVNAKENVKIIGGNIVGDMDTHPANTHNYCYGIIIANASKNVVVRDINIEKAEDDGIMIADYYTEEVASGVRTNNVDIINVNSSNNGRQGLTISTGWDIRVIDSEFSNQTKHYPKSGIDIEIESYDHIGVKNIEIVGNKLEGNEFGGIVISGMFNENPNTMSENIAIGENTISNSRYGIIASGKVTGLDIYNNLVNVSNMTNESSIAIGTASPKSKNVSIRGNKIVSDHKLTHNTIGVYSATPNGVEIKDNTLQGQMTGVRALGGDELISNNSISRVLGAAIKVTGNNQSLLNNEISLSGDAHMISGPDHTAIDAVGVNNLTVRGNKIHDLEGYGMRIIGGSKNTNIANNTIRNVGLSTGANKNTFFLIGAGTSNLRIDGNTLDKGSYHTLFLGINTLTETESPNYFTNNKITGFSNYGYGMTNGTFVISGNTGI